MRTNAGQFTNAGTEEERVDRAFGPPRCRARSRGARRGTAARGHAGRRVRDSRGRTRHGQLPRHRRAAGADPVHRAAAGRARALVDSDRSAVHAERPRRRHAHGRPAGRRALADARRRRRAAHPGAHPPLGVPAVLVDRARTDSSTATRRCPIALKVEPGRITELIKNSGLRGRGGAGFPTGHEVVVPAQGQHQAELPGDQRRRGRAGHVQGRAADDGRPALADRGLHHHLVRDPGTVLRDLRPRRGRACPAPGAERRRRGARRRATWARTSSAPATTSRSSCTPARARTSAARRPRCSTRSRAGAASRG